MKIAFLASIAGMLAGVILKIRPSIYGIEVKEEDTKDGVEAMISLLKAIKDGNADQTKTQNDLLRKIEKALNGCFVERGLTKLPID